MGSRWHSPRQRLAQLIGSDRRPQEQPSFPPWFAQAAGSNEPTIAQQGEVVARDTGARDEDVEPSKAFDDVIDRSLDGRP